jgi:hypothetical protein
LVGCGRVSGLLMRRVWPLALLRGSGPQQSRTLRRSVLTQRALPIPERPYLHYVVVPSPIGAADLSAGVVHAATGSSGSLYLSPWTMMAQATRAILLASATAATLVGRRSINRPSHGCFRVPCFCA